MPSHALNQGDSGNGDQSGPKEAAPIATMQVSQNKF
jgi:hypothetical protein